MPEILFAPMEGITGYVFRNAFFRTFGGISRFYAPFISPAHEEPRITGPSKRDILPAHNAGTPVVPQLLTNRAEDFLAAAGELQELGYREVNLNLGCPSGTVTAKKKGAGFLSETEALRDFLEEVTEHLPAGMRFSVKTRIGWKRADEFPELLRIFNGSPIDLLIIHPRVRGEFYRGDVHRDVFADAVRDARMPLCYNGDLNRAEDLRQIFADFPDVHSVMIGRGLLKNPFLAEEFLFRGTQNNPFDEAYRRNPQSLEGEEGRRGAHRGRKGRGGGGSFRGGEGKGRRGGGRGLGGGGGVSEGNPKKGGPVPQYRAALLHGLLWQNRNLKIV